MNWTVNISADDWLHPLRIERYEKAMTVAHDIVDYNMTVRRAAKEYCVCKSTISFWMDRYVKYLDYDLWREVKAVFSKHEFRGKRK